MDPRTLEWTVLLLAVVSLSLVGVPGAAQGPNTSQEVEPPPVTLDPDPSFGTEENQTEPEPSVNAAAPTAPSPGTGASGQPSADAGSGPMDGLGPAGIVVSLMVATAASTTVVVKRSRSKEEPEEEKDEDNDRSPVEHPGPEGALLMGRQALDEGDLQTARGWFDSALELDPSMNVAAFCQGLCARKMNDLDAAEASFRRAIEIDPTSGRARYHLAATLAQMGKTRQTVAELRPVVTARDEVAEKAYEDPAFEDLRDDPRFLALVDRMPEA